MSTLALRACLITVLFMCQRALVREKASRLVFIRNWVYFLKHTNGFNEHLMNAAFHLFLLVLGACEAYSCHSKWTGCCGMKERGEEGGKNLSPRRKIPTFGILLMGWEKIKYILKQKLYDGCSFVILVHWREETHKCGHKTCWQQL